MLIPMKRLFTILSFVALPLLCVAQSADVHPRLFLTDGQLAVLRTKLASADAYATPLHALVMQQADAALTGPAPAYTFDESGLRLLHQSRAAIRRIASCSYAWRTTGDVRYRDCVLADLATVCSFPDWNGPRHFLDAAEMALAVAVGCDWLWDELPDTLLQQCRRCVHDYAFTPALRPHWFYTTIGNWNQVCNGGVVAAALALWQRGDDATADRIVANAVESNRKALEGIYSPDGAYPEGPVYWNYGTMFEALLLTMLEDVTGTDYGLSSSEGFLRTARYETLTVGTSGLNFNYGDNSSREYCASALWYFAWKLGDMQLLDHELEVLHAGQYVNAESERFLTFQLCYAARLAGGGEEATEPQHWQTYFGRGTTPVMIVRSTSPRWGDRYLGVKGGSAGSSHGHMDAGTLVYDAWGMRWIMDPDRQEYATLEVLMAREGGSLFNLSQSSLRWQLLRFCNEAHSTLTINGARHSVKGSALMTATQEDASDGTVSATFDMSSVFAGEAARVVRTVTLRQARHLVVTDTIAALPDREATVRFTAVTPADVKVNRRSIRLSQGGHTLTLRARAEGTLGSPLRYTTWSSNPADYDTPFAHDEPPIPATLCGYTLTVPAGQQVVLTTTLR